MRGRQARNAGRRVARGGSFNNPPENLRSANRDDDDPENEDDNQGFRCVRVPPQHAARGAMQRLPRQSADCLSRPARFSSIATIRAGHPVSQPISTSCGP